MKKLSRTLALVGAILCALPSLALATDFYDIDAVALEKARESLPNAGKLIVRGGLSAYETSLNISTYAVMKYNLHVFEVGADGIERRVGIVAVNSWFEKGTSEHYVKGFTSVGKDDAVAPPLVSKNVAKKLPNNLSSLSSSRVNKISTLPVGARNVKFPKLHVRRI